MVMAMEDSADEETAKRLRKVDFLNVVGQLAPMAGLFGTVYGMILAFQSIVSAGGNADPVLLAGGIGTALVTTFWGLVVAIPALMGYAVIRNRILNASEEVIAEVTKLIRPFDADLRKASAPAAKPASSIEPSGDSASEAHQCSGKCNDGWRLMSTLIHTRRKHPPTQVESNLTSMIDVVFLLIVFFVLVFKWSAVKRSPWICQKCQTRRQPLRGRNLGWWSTCCPMPNSQALVFAPWCWGNLSPSMPTAARRWPRGSQLI